MTPDTHTITETFLEVTDGHSLYIHEWGNVKATTTIIHLHGGPGSGTSDRAKQNYDPLKQRVIFFDQRGAGKSLPYGELGHNTTDDLVDDLDRIADHFKLETFILVGGSWGSCLALAYAVKHPKRVQAMVLNGIFTGSKPEIAWVDQGMFRIFLPDVWETFLQATPATHQAEPTSYHYKNIVVGDDDSSKRSAYALSNMESAIMALDDRFTPDDYETFDPTATKIEVHYLANKCFLPNNYILDNADKLTMPVYIVQGRYDMVCPPKTAYTLAQALPQGEIIWTTSGHRWERESWAVVRTLLRQLATS